jgi:AraC family transcriptional regulator
MNQAIDYLESVMGEEISLEKAARQSGYSLRDFQQIFAFLTNTTIGMYIRKRKLSLAANDIMVSDEKIIDIAFKYGYESPTAFSRAFSQLFGVSPSSARDEGITLELYPKFSFNKLLFEESKVNAMENMEKYLTRGYHVSFLMLLCRHI